MLIWLKNNAVESLVVALMLLSSSVFAQSGPVDAADAVGRFVVQIDVVLANGKATGSGVILESGHILTAKHVVEDAVQLFVVTVNGDRSAATVAAITDQFDGPALLTAGVMAGGLSLVDSVPPIGESVRMYGYGRDGKLFFQKCKLQGGVTISDGRESIRANVTDCTRIQPGDSGGPMVTDDGRVIGCVLFRAADESAGACSFAELRNVFQNRIGGGRRAERGDVVTLITSIGCRPCLQAKADIDAGKFADLPVRFVVKNIGLVPGVDSTPAFQFRGSLWQPERYSVEAVRSWIQERLAAGAGSSIVVPPAESPAEALVDIDWSGVRFGVLVAETAPVYLRSAYILGPVQRLLDVATGGTVPIEVFSQVENLERFEAVSAAVGIGKISSVYAFATVDSILDVGLMKRMVVKKITAAFDEKIHGEDHTFLPDLVFRRSSPQQWEAVVAAMADRSENVVTGDDRSMAQTLIGLIFGLISGMVSTRGIRGTADYLKEKWLADAVEDPEPVAVGDFFADAEGGAG